MADEEIKNKIIQTKGISISTPGGNASAVYGGYPYSLQYSINFTSPSRMTVSFVSEDGKYNEEALRNRIFPGQMPINGPLNPLNPNNPPTNNPTLEAGGAITFDIITFGDETFNMHPLRYTIQDGASGRFLSIEYYDRSIAFLDKVIVALDGKHYPPIFQPYYLANFGVDTTINRSTRGQPWSPYIIGLGNTYLPRSVAQDSGVLPAPDVNKESKYLCPEYLYSPYELYQGIVNNPIIGPRTDASVQLLWWYGKFLTQGQDGLNWGNEMGKNSDAKYLKNFHGTLREVLQQWAQIFGFMFYWESQKGEDKLKLMDLRNGTTFSNISKVVEDLVAKVVPTTVDGKAGDSNVVNLSKSYSIAETFSQGAASYMCMDGKENVKPFTTSMKNVDLLTLPIWSCSTKIGENLKGVRDGADEDCELWDHSEESRTALAATESKRYYLPNYCETNCTTKTQDCDYINPYEMIKTSTLRSGEHKIEVGNTTVKGKEILSSYVRLLKAALISPEFYRTYVLLKKSNSYSNLPFSSQRTYKGKGLNEVNNYKYDINADPGGGKSAFHTAEIDGGKSGEKQIVNHIYPSGGPVSLGYRNKLGYFNILCYPNPGNRSKTDPKAFEAYDLEMDNQMSSWNYTLGRDCISLQRVTSKIFEQLLFNDDRIRQAFGISSADSAKRGRGDDKTRHFNIYRLKKYGNTQLIQEPQEDHIYKLLKTIATHQGQFYYHAGLVSKEEFGSRHYIDKSIGWLDRELCSNDSPFAALQDGVDPLSEERKKEMPTACVGFKDRASAQEDAHSKPFKSGNLANFTVEQFIQQVYAETITGIDPQRQAVLAIEGLTPAGALKSIGIIDGGDGYRNGVLPVIIKGKNVDIAEAEATVAGGTIISIAVLDPGSGYGNDVTVAVLGYSGQGLGRTYNVFGNKISCDEVGDGGAGRQCADCITASNITFRDEQYKDGIKKGRKTICQPPDTDGIIYKDFGPNIPLIPQGVADQIERFEKGFYIIPSTHPNEHVRFHNEADMQLLVLPTVGGPGTAGVIIPTAGFKAADELDWILDQVSVPNLDMVLIAASKEPIKPKKGSFIGLSKREDPKVRNKDEIAYESAWLGRGPKFEQSVMVEPMFKSNVAGVRFKEVNPTAGDLGVEEVNCVPAKDRNKKIKKDQKKIKENIRNYTEMYAFHEGDVEFNVRMTVMGDGIKDPDGKIIVLSIEDGLEGISAQVDGDGVVFEYTIGTRRKRSVLEGPNADMWLKVKPELFNSVFDI